MTNKDAIERLQSLTRWKADLVSTPATIASGGVMATPKSTPARPPKLPPVLGNPRPSLRTRLLDMVIGQDHVVDDLVAAIELYEVGLGREEGPAYSALLMGPTGVGKTWLVEALAYTLHGSKRKFLRVDCGEYQHSHEVAKLIGAPPGYLGHRETGSLLSNKALAETTSEHCDLAVVLLDEIEKAHHSVYQLLLGILDKATLRLGDNTTTDFSKTLILMTSNVGAGDLRTSSAMGLAQDLPGAFTTPLISYDALVRRCEAAARKHFSPEFINRLDALQTFHVLGRDAHELILDRLLDDVQDRVDNRSGGSDITLHYGENVEEWLLKRGTDTRYGARDLRRAVEKYVLRPVGRALLTGAWRELNVSIAPGAESLLVEGVT